MWAGGWMTLGTQQGTAWAWGQTAWLFMKCAASVCVCVCVRVRDSEGHCERVMQKTMSREALTVEWSSALTWHVQYTRFILFLHLLWKTWILTCVSIKVLTFKQVTSSYDIYVLFTDSALACFPPKNILRSHFSLFPTCCLLIHLFLVEFVHWSSVTLM